jgi:predicted transcriptional regulator
MQVVSGAIFEAKSGARYAAAMEQAGITVKEAAARLGTSERAVRFRLQRGTLHGTKVQGAWFVYLDGAPPAADAVVPSGNDTALAVVLPQLVETLRQQAEEIGRLRATNELLQQQVQALRRPWWKRFFRTPLA